jgi:8-oxo-dGTP pyrophosphatase MutT (NUDIX family)
MTSRPAAGKGQSLEPRIASRNTTRISPWVDLIARSVDWGRGDGPEIYHAVGQADYVGIWAMTPGGLSAVVRQYRPAVERHTWEFPAGMVDGDEDPAATCVRELNEETGLVARKVHSLGTYAPDTARLSNAFHAFFVETNEPSGDFEPEPGMSVRLLDFPALCSLIVGGDFGLQSHIGLITLALLSPSLAAILPAQLEPVFS